MRALLIVICYLLLISCGETEKIDSSNSSIQDGPSGISYIKDTKTNLCFAVIYGSPGYANGRSASIVCVPCDSLKQLK